MDSREQPTVLEQFHHATDTTNVFEDVVELPCGCVVDHNMVNFDLEYDCAECPWCDAVYYAGELMVHLLDIENIAARGAAPRKLLRAGDVLLETLRVENGQIAARVLSRVVVRDNPPEFQIGEPHSLEWLRN